jgi:(p)ppGpp synthase/HD superfamily hydrolase
VTSRLATSYEDMANKPLNTELLDRAIVFAVRAHAGTERRGKGFPYIVHPMEAVEIVATMTSDQLFTTQWKTLMSLWIRYVLSLVTASPHL